MTTKANYVDIQFGSRIIDGVMLPDGSYRMSRTQAAEFVGNEEFNARDFFKGKAVKTLLGKGYTTGKNEKIQLEREARGTTQIVPLTLDEVGAYWVWQCYRGNKKAMFLCFALITESLERRFDTAFGIERSEAEQNSLLQQRLETLESDLEKLGEGYATEDLLRQENQYFREVFDRLGIDPYGLPGA